MRTYTPDATRELTMDEMGERLVWAASQLKERRDLGWATGLVVQFPTEDGRAWTARTSRR